MFSGIIETSLLCPLYFLSVLHIHFILYLAQPPGSVTSPMALSPSSLHLSFLENPTLDSLNTCLPCA